MAKITLSPIVGSYASVTALNARLQQIEDALNDNVLWRDGFVAEPNVMVVDLDMGGNELLNVVYDHGSSTIEAAAFTQDGSPVVAQDTQYYFGGLAAHPSFKLDGSPLGVGDSYFNTVSEETYTYNGSGWVFAIPSVATNAVDVAIADAGAHYTGIEVEAALQEVGAEFTRIGSTANGEGASIVGIEDAGAYFTGTDVEAATQELGADIAALNPIGRQFDETLTPTGLSSVFGGSIPSWANKIIIEISGLYVNTGATPMYMQLATADVVTQTGAAGVAMGVSNSGSTSVGAFPTTAFTIADTVSTSSVDVLTGTIVLTKQDSTNSWFITGQLGKDGTARYFATTGAGAASDVVDSLKFYNSVGTSLWQAGSQIDIYYEA